MARTPGEPKITLSDFVRNQTATIKSYKAAWLAGQKEQGTGAYPRKMTAAEWQANYSQYAGINAGEPEQAQAAD